MQICLLQSMIFNTIGVHLGKLEASRLLLVYSNKSMLKRVISGCLLQARNWFTKTERCKIVCKLSVGVNLFGVFLTWFKLRLIGDEKRIDYNNNNHRFSYNDYANSF